MTARILIVEDEALVAMELRFLLEDLGHDVVGVAADTRAARDLTRENDVDLALVDVHLSDGPTGVELGREIADHGVTVMYVTANPGMVRNGASGALGVLSKPTDERAVQKAVDFALSRRSGDAARPAPPELQLLA